MIDKRAVYRGNLSGAFSRISMLFVDISEKVGYTRRQKKAGRQSIMTLTAPFLLSYDMQTDEKETVGNIPSIERG